MRNTGSNTFFKFDFKSFLIFIIFFIIEVIIALYIDDDIIRPYGGDVLVIPLMFYFIKSFLNVKSIYLIIGVLLFAYLVEIGQYFRLVEILGLQSNRIMRTIIGSSFSWFDILAYTLGAVICYLFNRKD